MNQVFVPTQKKYVEMNKTFKNLRRYYYWPGMTTSTCDYNKRYVK